MNAKKSRYLCLVAIVALLIAACSPRTPPEEILAVNEKNCHPESIAKITDSNSRGKFQEMCVRGGAFKSSPLKKW